MASPAPAAPTHIIRAHKSPVSALHISSDNSLIYSGDSSGWVFVTSTRSLRTIASWQAHSDAILGLEETLKTLITHGRDNKLHAWPRPRELPASAQVGGSAVAGAAAHDSIQSNENDRRAVTSMDVNALNYCRFSLLRSPDHAGDLIALPNLVDSSCADIWLFPACDRLHAAIGKPKDAPTIPLDGRGNEKTGIIMSLHLFRSARESSFSSELRLLCAYENGGVTLRRCTRPFGEKTVEGKGWEVIWTSKVHVESIMAMSVTRNSSVALTVSADHLVGRYDLNAVTADTASTVHRTKHPGNGCVAIRDDGRVCAIGGWDGSIRLYSTKSLKPLGTLRYHKTACQALAFAHASAGADERHSGDAADSDEEDVAPPDLERWLIAGGKDTRLSIWSLQSFERAQ
ncbi:WD40-repeat-containing domain protein [Schizophyllum fasciatum]